MDKLNKYAQNFIKQEVEKVNLNVFQNKSGREGVDFIIKTASGNFHEVYLQAINLKKERSVNLTAGRQVCFQN